MPRVLPFGMYLHMLNGLIVTPANKLNPYEKVIYMPNTKLIKEALCEWYQPTVQPQRTTNCSTLLKTS